MADHRCQRRDDGQAPLDQRFRPFPLLLGLAHHWGAAAPFLALAAFVLLYRLADPERGPRRLALPLYVGAMLYFGILNAWYAPLWDDFAHFAVIFWLFSALSLATLPVAFVLAARSLRSTLRVPLWASLPILWVGQEASQSILGFHFGNGAALELAQSALPDRIASFYDVLANTIGIVLGSLFASGANTVWPKHRPSNG